MSDTYMILRPDLTTACKVHDILYSNVDVTSCTARPHASNSAEHKQQLVLLLRVPLFVKSAHKLLLRDGLRVNCPAHGVATVLLRIITVRVLPSELVSLSLSQAITHPELSMDRYSVQKTPHVDWKGTRNGRGM